MMEEMIDLLRSLDARLRRTNALLAIIARMAAVISSGRSGS
jgi:hypothetical protein